MVTLPAKSHANPLPAAVAGTPVAGPELVSDLQTELKRVGCYDGPIDGIWTPQTRQAMITLVQRSNARLPTDKADHVLLALVKNHTGSACGSCPAGQDELPEGRCVPHAIAARVAVLRPVSNSHLSAEEPRIVDVEQPQPSRRSRRGAPIDGRMSVGAPIVAARASKVEPKIAAVEPTPSSPAPAIQHRREKRAGTSCKPPHRRSFARLLQSDASASIRLSTVRPASRHRCRAVRVVLVTTRAARLTVRVPSQLHKSRALKISAMRHLPELQCQERADENYGLAEAP